MADQGVERSIFAGKEAWKKEGEGSCVTSSEASEQEVKRSSLADREVLRLKGERVCVTNIEADESKHCKRGLFDKQFCKANTAILTSFITFQRNHNEIFH